MEAVYHVPDMKPKAAGPWRQEAEKVAWTDSETGLACIIRRDRGGHLCGFVAIGADHPLFGFDSRAIPRALVSVHAGLNYSELCDERVPENLSICHVVGQRKMHDDKWWLGFVCAELDDFSPGLPNRAADARDLGVQQTYRDERYVYGQCTSLAAQLSALAAGASASPDPEHRPSFDTFMGDK
jgi:hypothetical protein